MESLEFPQQKWEVGRCTLDMEQSDLLHVHFRGKVWVAEVEEMKQILHALGERIGRFDVLMSVVELETPIAGAHRAWVTTSKPYLFRHVAEQPGEAVEVVGLDCAV